MERLKSDIKMCERHISRSVVDMLKEGLWFNEESRDADNAHIRMLFIDVLTRRYLLRSNTVMLLI